MEQNPYQPPTAEVRDVLPGVSSDAVMLREGHIGHEASIKAIGMLYYLGGAMLVFGGLLQLTNINKESIGFIGAMTALLLGLSVLYFWMGSGLRALRANVKHVVGVFAAIGLVGFPLGTLINGYILYLLYSKKGKMVFSDEYKAIRLATPDIKYKTPLVIWLLLALLVLFVATAILVPMFSQH